MNSPGGQRVLPSRAFTLVEMLVSMAILVLILTVVVGITNAVSKVWRSSQAKVESFEGARLAFETVTRSLSHATLNTYYDYYNKTYQSYTQVAGTSSGSGLSTFYPFTYGRSSELEFVCGKTLVTAPPASQTQITHSVFFQTPAGYTAIPGTYGTLGKLLNATGVYLVFDNNQSDRPTFLGNLPHAPPLRYRFRLMEFLQPTENLSIYATTFPNAAHPWFSTNLSDNSFLLAENIIALIVLPRAPTDPVDTSTATINSDFEYDSQTTWTSGTQPISMNQLPPVVHVILIAADEPSMARLQGTSTTQPNLGFNYNQVFQSSAGGTLPSDPTTLATDLQTVTAALVQKRVNYRIFTTDVAILAAKWSN